MSGQTKSVATIPGMTIKGGTIEFGPEQFEERREVIRQTEATDRTSRELSKSANWFFFFAFIALLIVFTFSLYAQNNILALLMLVVMSLVFYYSMVQKYEIDAKKHEKSLETQVELMKSTREADKPLDYSKKKI